MNCPKCGKVVASAFTYCPYCAQLLTQPLNLTPHHVSGPVQPAGPGHFIDEEEDGPALDVPDVMEEIIGWRAWYLMIGSSRLLRLRAINAGGGDVNKRGIWKPGGWKFATCSVQHEAHKARGDRIPVEGCSCGFYAAKTREQLVGLGYNHYSEAEHRVIGEVAMAGKVIVCSQGWRAEKVRPKKLYVPHEHWRLAKRLGEIYECEVGTTNLWKAS